MRILMLIHKATYMKGQSELSGGGSIVIDSITLVQILQCAKQFLGPLGEREVLKLRLYSMRLPEMSKCEKERLGLYACLSQTHRVIEGAEATCFSLPRIGTGSPRCPQPFWRRLACSHRSALSGS